MTAHPAERLDLEALEDLDFDFDPPCEHYNHGNKSWHSGPAWALVDTLHIPCGHAPVSPGPLYICRGAWERAGTVGMWCLTCREKFTREQGWRFIALVRP